MYSLSILGKERVGPCNLVEVASPFHGNHCRKCDLHVLYMTSEHVGEKRVGPCNYIEVASTFHVLTTLLKSQTSWS